MNLEDIKSEIGNFFNRLLETDLISYAAYVLIFDDVQAAIDAAYKIGKNENSKTQKGAMNECKN